jgi:hypothetical protein
MDSRAVSRKLPEGCAAHPPRPFPESAISLEI